MMSIYPDHSNAKNLKSHQTFYTFESSLLDHEDDFDPPRPSLHLSTLSNSNPMLLTGKHKCINIQCQEH